MKKKKKAIMEVELPSVSEIESLLKTSVNSQETFLKGGKKGKKSKKKSKSSRSKRADLRERYKLSPRKRLRKKFQRKK